MGVFPKPGYNGGPHDTGHPPGGKYAAVDGAEFLCAKDIGKICRHAGKASAVPNIPVPKKAMDRRPLFFGPCFSTNRPKNPADMPKNRMAKENVQVVSDKVKPISAIMGRVKTLQA